MRIVLIVLALLFGVAAVVAHIGFAAGGSGWMLVIALFLVLVGVGLASLARRLGRKSGTTRTY